MTDRNARGVQQTRQNTADLLRHAEALNEIVDQGSGTFPWTQAAGAPGRTDIDRTRREPSRMPPRVAIGVLTADHSSRAHLERVARAGHRHRSLDRARPSAAEVLPDLERRGLLALFSRVIADGPGAGARPGVPSLPGGLPSPRARPPTSSSCSSSSRSARFVKRIGSLGDGDH